MQSLRAGHDARSAEPPDPLPFGQSHAYQEAISFVLASLITVEFARTSRLMKWGGGIGLSVVQPDSFHYHFGKDIRQPALRRLRRLLRPMNIPALNGYLYFP
jgi:hypothetical protein